jgi:hypothetical protein
VTLGRAAGVYRNETGKQSRMVLDKSQGRMRGSYVNLSGSLLRMMMENDEARSTRAMPCSQPSGLILLRNSSHKSRSILEPGLARALPPSIVLVERDTDAIEAVLTADTGRLVLRGLDACVQDIDDWVTGIAAASIFDGRLWSKDSRLLRDPASSFRCLSPWYRWNRGNRETTLGCVNRDDRLGES